MSIEKFGHDVGAFLRGLLSVDVTYSEPSNKYHYESPSPQEKGSTSSYRQVQKNTYNEGKNNYKIAGAFNQAAKLIPGNLLILCLPQNKCFQLDTESERITFLFDLRWGPQTFFWKAIVDVDGSIYCSVSGTVTSEQPPIAQFGNWGAVTRVNHRIANIETLAEGNGVTDPYGLQLLEDKRLLVSDFNSFDGTGSIYILDPASRSVEIVAKGGRLKEPVSAVMDKNGLLWVANSDQTVNDGEILRIDPGGTQTVILPRQGAGAGAVVGVLQSIKPEELVIFVNDWPEMVNSSIFLLNKENGRKEILFQASSDEPQFYSTVGDIDGTTLWFGECVEGYIVGYDLERKEVLKRIYVGSLYSMGGFKGMMHSYHGIESVTVIPRDMTVV